MLEFLLRGFVALLGAYVAALWLGLAIWAYRDACARSKEAAVRLGAFFFSFFFGLPGLLLYILLRPRDTLAEAYSRTLEEETLLQEIEEQLACPNCRRRIEEDFLLCPHCRSQLKQRCGRCERLMHLRWLACAYCGTPASGGGRAGGGQPSRIEETAAVS